MNLIRITPLILTKNEEANIGRSLNRLAWADHIIVLDSGSGDRTEEICRTYANVEWHQRPFDTHAQQWNAGLALVRSPWVLTLDADYLLSTELVEEIHSLPEIPEANGFYIPFIYQIKGTSLSQSLLPPRLALFKKEKGSYFQDGHSQDLCLQGAVLRLKNPIYHDDRKPFHRWWAAQEKYADMEVEKLSRTSWQQLSMQDRLRRLIFPAPVAVLFFTLLVKRNFLDGKAGWIYTGQRFLAEVLLSFKLLIAWIKA